MWNHQVAPPVIFLNVLNIGLKAPTTLLAAVDLVAVLANACQVLVVFGGWCDIKDRCGLLLWQQAATGMQAENEEIDTMHSPSYKTPAFICFTKNLFLLCAPPPLSPLERPSASS